MPYVGIASGGHMGFSYATMVAHFPLLRVIHFSLHINIFNQIKQFFLQNDKLFGICSKVLK